MKQQREAGNLPKELQKLGLPVFQSVSRHLYHVLIPLNWLLMGLLLIHVSEPSQCPINVTTKNPPVTQAKPYLRIPPIDDSRLFRPVTPKVGDGCYRAAGAVWLIENASLD